MYFGSQPFICLCLVLRVQHVPDPAPDQHDPGVHVPDHPAHPDAAAAVQTSAVHLVPLPQEGRKPHHETLPRNGRAQETLLSDCTVDGEHAPG